MVAWSADQPRSLSVGGLAGRSVGRLVCQRFGALADRPIDRRTDARLLEVVLMTHRKRFAPHRRGAFDSSELLIAEQLTQPSSVTVEENAEEVRAVIILRSTITHRVAHLSGVESAV